MPFKTFVTMSLECRLKRWYERRLERWYERRLKRWYERRLKRNMSKVFPNAKLCLNHLPQL